ncbi:hypothetical protein [Chelativorans sp. YIM 93263]|uniref:hypothetical protein n=1 Tax=Chelativorans sp. YIM 93263 TaxID=2906648 RepID=UPI002377E9CE|nr:hypothetical protein [Chelativorans sp. YIM 93263]
MNGWMIERRGAVVAIMRQGPRFVASVDGDAVGFYHAPEAALLDLLGGHTASPSSGVDTSKLDLPEDLSEWKRLCG